MSRLTSVTTVALEKTGGNCWLGTGRINAGAGAMFSQVRAPRFRTLEQGSQRRSRQARQSRRRARQASRRQSA